MTFIESRASTQNQTLNALVFLYKRVLGRELEAIGETQERALRVKDIDFNRTKDRVSMLPTSCKHLLLEHLGRVRAIHTDDLRRKRRCRTPWPGQSMTAAFYNRLTHFGER
jgi:hypothetical protein